MNSAHSIALRLLAALTLAAGMASPVIGEEPTPAAIYETIRAQFEYIKSFDISSRSVFVQGEIEPDLSWTVDSAEARAGADARDVRIQQQQARQKGDMFRNCLELPEERVDFAYDGSQYQLFNHDHRILRQLDETVARDTIVSFRYSGVKTLLQPYEFATHVAGKKTMVSLAMLREASFWESLAVLSEVRGEEVVGEHPCVVMDITNTKHEQYGAMRARVCFAKDLPYFPVRYELYIGDDIFYVFEAERIGESASCKKRPDDIPASYFAEKSVLRHFDWMGSGRPVGASVIEIDVERARVNCEIPDAFFTIASSEALYVFGDQSTD